MPARCGEEAAHAAKGGGNGGHGELQKDSAHGAAEDDEGRGGLQDLAEVSAFEEQAGDDSGDGQNDSADA